MVESQVALGRVLPTPATMCGAEMLLFHLAGLGLKSQACYDGEQLTFGAGMDPGEFWACQMTRCGGRKGENMGASVSSTVQV